MSKEKRIEQEVEKTLDCLDQFQRIDPNSSFSTRVISKIHGSDNQRRRSFRPILSYLNLKPVLLLILILFNLVSAFLLLWNDEAPQNSKNEYILSLIDEYDLNYTGYFSINQKEER